MKRPSRPRIAVSRSLVAFCVTVTLALVASLTQLLPDVTAQSADAMSRMPDGLDQMLSGSGLDAVK